MDKTINNSTSFTERVPLPKNIPITYIWFGKAVPEDYLISLSELNYPIIFLKNPQLNRKFSRDLLDIQKSDYYRLQFLYENGGIYSDFDNILDYPCLMNLLEPYRNTNYLVFMTDGQHTRKKTGQMTNNLIFAPYPKMPILKKMLDAVNQNRGKVWKFSGMKFVANFKQPLQVNMSKCVKHTGDWSWFEASNQVLGKKKPPHSRFIIKKHKKKQIVAQNQLLKQYVKDEKVSKQSLQKSRKNIIYQNSQLRVWIKNMTMKLKESCPISNNINLIESNQQIKSKSQNNKSQVNQTKKPTTFHDKTELESDRQFDMKKYHHIINSFKQSNKMLSFQNKLYQYEMYSGGGILLIFLILLILWKLKRRNYNKDQQFDS